MKTLNEAILEASQIALEHPTRVVAVWKLPGHGFAHTAVIDGKMRDTVPAGSVLLLTMRGA